MDLLFIVLRLILISVEFGCSYVITSVEKGNAAITNSFELAGSDEANKQLIHEMIEISSESEVSGQSAQPQALNPLTAALCLSGISSHEILFSTQGANAVVIERQRQFNWRIR
jgi:hypothetical protein